MCIRDRVDGMQFDRGYLSDYFVTNTEKMECEMEKPYILIYDKKISNLKEMCIRDSAILDTIYSIDGHFDIDTLYSLMADQENFRVSRATLYNTIRCV